VNVGSNHIIEGLFVVACASLGMDSLHKRCFVLAMITQPQECAASERKKAGCIRDPFTAAIHHAANFIVVMNF
jgi:hypothetical protein